jgi:hypothetical protein
MKGVAAEFVTANQPDNEAGAAGEREAGHADQRKDQVRDSINRRPFEVKINTICTFVYKYSLAGRIKTTTLLS